MSDALKYLIKARPEAMGSYFTFLKEAGKHLVEVAELVWLKHVVHESKVFDGFGVAWNGSANVEVIRHVSQFPPLVLSQPAYFNLAFAGSNNALDWVVGIAGEVFVDQKTMALFSMLFGAGIVVFADRAEAKGGLPPTGRFSQSVVNAGLSAHTVGDGRAASRKRQHRGPVWSTASRVSGR